MQHRDETRALAAALDDVDRRLGPGYIAELLLEYHPRVIELAQAGSSRLVGGLLHDLLHAVTYSSGAAEALIEALPDERGSTTQAAEQIGRLRVTQNDLNRMARLLRDVAYDGLPIPNTRWGSVATLWRDVENMCYLHTYHTRTAWIYEGPKLSVRSADLVKQVLLQLGLNSCEAARWRSRGEGFNVTLRGSFAGEDQVVLTHRAGRIDGRAARAAEAARMPVVELLFQPGFSTWSGVGMGLSIARIAARRAGGHLFARVERSDELEFELQTPGRLDT